MEQFANTGNGAAPETMSLTLYEITDAEGPSRWLVTADHASNAVPAEIDGGSLGLADADMARHIAWDPGARGLALALGKALDAPVLCAGFSRLVIDPNRGEDDPTLLMKIADGSIIPANRHADSAELERRLELCYRPYHAAYARLVARRADTVICAVHSFTPALRGREPRPWQVGVLHSHRDSRLAAALLTRLRAEPDLCIGDNEPYSGHLDGDAIDRHALAHGLPNVLVELRQDLIVTPAQQQHWARRLAPALAGALADAGL